MAADAVIVLGCKTDNDDDENGSGKLPLGAKVKINEFARQQAMLGGTGGHSNFVT